VDKKKPVKKSNKSNTRTVKDRIAETKAELLEHLRTWHGNVFQACRAAGVDRITYYRYLDDPDFKAATETINEESKDKAEWVLLDAMQSGHFRDSVKAAEIYLKARAKERGYGTERRETEHSGSLGIDAKIEKVRFELPDNQTGSDSVGPAPWETTASGG